MSNEENMEHAKRYSQTFKRGYGMWADDPSSMSKKTVLKLLLKKYAPKSIENIGSAILADQAAFKGDVDNKEAYYPDNQPKIEGGEYAEFEEATDNKEQPSR